MRLGPRILKAHRLMWQMEHGSIPAGMFVCHHCDNPPCTNPAHLFLGTNAENMRDMRRKGRGVPPPVRFGGPGGVPPKLRGEKHGRAKLSSGDVLDARAAYGAGARIAELARRYGVHPRTMRDALLGKHWSHLS
jgi:hypothetical protein